MRPKLTRELAWVASQDAANRAMRKGGRTAWSEEDYRVMTAEFDRLWPVHLDVDIARGTFELMFGPFNTQELEP